MSDIFDLSRRHSISLLVQPSEPGDGGQRHSRRRIAAAAEVQSARRVGREIVRHVTIAAEDDGVLPFAELRVAGLRKGDGASPPLLQDVDWDSLSEEG